MCFEYTIWHCYRVKVWKSSILFLFLCLFCAILSISWCYGFLIPAFKSTSDGSIKLSRNTSIVQSCSQPMSPQMRMKTLQWLLCHVEKMIWNRPLFIHVLWIHGWTRRPPGTLQNNFCSWIKQETLKSAVNPKKVRKSAKLHWDSTFFQ